MPVCEQMEDRRKDARFRPEDGAFVVAAGSVGRILDISKGGLAFSYLRLQDAPLASEHLEVIVDGSSLLREIPIQKLAEDKLENRFPTSPMMVNRCRVEFGSLTARQLQVLSDFLERQTGMAAPAMPAWQV